MGWALRVSRAAGGGRARFTRFCLVVGGQALRRRGANELSRGRSRRGRGGGSSRPLVVRRAQQRRRAAPQPRQPPEHPLTRSRAAAEADREQAARSPRPRSLASPQGTRAPPQLSPGSRPVHDAAQAAAAAAAAAGGGGAVGRRRAGGGDRRLALQRLAQPERARPDGGAVEMDRSSLWRAAAAPAARAIAAHPNPRADPGAARRLRAGRGAARLRRCQVVGGACQQPCAPLPPGPWPSAAAQQRRRPGPTAGRRWWSWASWTCRGTASRSCPRSCAPWRR
jgi:hypothetical protein